ncbi:MAG: hypothetical protein JWM21_4947 [Acidobacteria bacterium]|jgi:hypothetical protein|nr:hypothetical protein [Acidobacteriota bacterium]
MNQKIRIIKYGTLTPNEPKLDQQEQAGRQGTREITGTIKLWISEYKERRRTEEHHTRTANKLILTALQ